LRAPLRWQLGRAGAVLILGGQAERRTALAARISGLPVLKAALRPAGPAASALSGRRVLAFCGIGRPAKFFETVLETGADLVQGDAFPDHHAYTQQDAEKLLAAAARLKADLLTTEKDLARMAGAGGAVEMLRTSAGVLPVEVAFDEDGEAALSVLLDAALVGRTA
jgi:tetraacyldisaccharide 4'-kinase